MTDWVEIMREAALRAAHPSHEPSMLEQLAHRQSYLYLRDRCDALLDVQREWVDAMEEAVRAMDADLGQYDVVMALGQEARLNYREFDVLHGELQATADWLRLHDREFLDRMDLYSPMGERY